MPNENTSSTIHGTPNQSANRAIANWLFTIAAMIFAMIVLGGVTRLTQSGLSMVEWNPVTGWLPPLNDDVWEEMFAKYRAFPEYQEKNAGMTLGEFKGIFWFEFLHRLLGRIIGVAFFVPYLFFVLKGWVKGGLAWRLGVIFILGGLQGGLGWFMVKSGLVDRPDVSQYRLAAHLCLALLIYGAILWVALSLITKPSGCSVSSSFQSAALYLTALIFLTAFSGALVAGLDAGLIYNTFPLMDGELIPDGLMEMSPGYINLFENIMTVQFDHRVLAVVTFGAVVLFWFSGRKAGLAPSQSAPLNYLAVMVFVQIGLGISTLLMVVPVSLGALHQAGAVVLLGFAIWTAHAVRS